MLALSNIVRQLDSGDLHLGILLIILVPPGLACWLECGKSLWMWEGHLNPAWWEHPRECEGGDGGDGSLAPGELSDWYQQLREGKGCCLDTQLICSCQGGQAESLALPWVWWPQPVLGGLWLWSSDGLEPVVVTAHKMGRGSVPQLVFKE